MEHNQSEQRRSYPYGTHLYPHLAHHLQAKHPEVADTGIKMAGHEGNPFHNII